MYRSVSNPNHVAANLSQTCTTCHTTTRWTGARYTAHRFPIYSGAHSGKWTKCNDCHNNATNYTVFNCLGCHEHNKTKMDDKHKGRQGYAYNSVTCYGCHPQGRH
ncbi:MAG: hypothetical protein JNL62_26750 [Bryobacterales bacterium]|nr:hypothetical protein [Bryobacterales bacterium]